MEITTPIFEGFYESIHDYNMEYVCETLEQDYDTVCDKIDFKQYQQDYSKAYIESLKELLSEHNINIPIKFIELDSPKYYNYRTDWIIIGVNPKDLKIKTPDDYVDGNVFEAFETLLKELDPDISEDLYYRTIEKIDILEYVLE